MASTLDAVKARMEGIKAEANRAFERQKFSAAASLYTEALTTAPSGPVPSELKAIVSILLTNRAMCYKQLDRFDEMEADAKRSMEVDRLNPKAHYLLGLAHSRREEWVPSVRAMETALEMAKRQKKSPSLLSEFEGAIAKARFLWNQSSLAEDREMDAILLSGLQDALDVKKEADVAKLSRESRTNTSAAGMPTIIEKTGEADEDVIEVSDHEDEAPELPASAGAQMPAPSPSRVRPGSAMPSSSSSSSSATSSGSKPRPQSAGAAFASRVTGIFKSAADSVMKRRASVRYDASVLADDAAVKGFASSSSSSPPSPTSSSSSSAAGDAASSSSGGAAASAGSEFDPRKPILQQHAEFSAQLSEIFAEREKKRRLGKVPDWAVCSITLDVMLEPVLSLASGQSYERAAIERYLKGKAEDPTTRKPLRADQLVPNLGLKAAITEWLHQNPGHHPLLPAEMREED